MQPLQGYSCSAVHTLSSSAKAAKLLTCVRQVAGSNLARHTGNSHHVFCCFLSPSRLTSGEYLGQDRFIPDHELESIDILREEQRTTSLTL